MNLFNINVWFCTSFRPCCSVHGTHCQGLFQGCWFACSFCCVSDVEALFWCRQPTTRQDKKPRPLGRVSCAITICLVLQDDQSVAGFVWGRVITTLVC